MRKESAMFAVGLSMLACGTGPTPPSPPQPQPPAVILATAQLPAPPVATPVADGPALLALIPEDAHDAPYAIGDAADGSTNGQAVALTRDVVVAGIPCADGLSVNAYPNNWDCTLSASTTIAGVDHAKGDPAVLYYDGHPKVLRSAGNIDVGGVPCAQAALLTPEGTLDGCPLAGPHDFQGGLHLEGNSMTGLTVFLESGVLVRIRTTGDPITIAGHSYEGGHSLAVDASGVVTDEGSAF